MIDLEHLTTEELVKELMRRETFAGIVVWKLYATRPRAVLFEREMRSGVMMILKIARQYATQMTLVEDDNVIQAFTADRTDQSLDIGVLQGDRGGQ